MCKSPAIERRLQGFFFGKGYKLVVISTYFVILGNSGTRSILIFDRNGKFHTKFKVKKLSGEENYVCRFLLPFTVWQERKEIIF